MNLETVLIGMVRDCKDSKQVIHRLIDKKIIPAKILHDVQIYQTYQQKAKKLPRLTAVFDTAIIHHVSESKVYRVRKKFETHKKWQVSANDRRR